MGILISSYSIFERQYFRIKVFLFTKNDRNFIVLWVIHTLQEFISIVQKKFLYVSLSSVGIAKAGSSKRK